jgi:multidrug efflux pump subunit AcrA (membrane-fusion protein)
MKRSKIVAIAALGAALAATAWLVLRPTPVTTTTVVKGKAISAVYATGTVECDERVRVKARSAGRVTELLVEDGSRVKAGELLARIDDTTGGYDLERARVDLWAASKQAREDSPRLLGLRNRRASVEVDLANARRERARSAGLTDTGSVGQAELDRADARVASLESTLAALIAEETAAGIDLSASRGQKAAIVGALSARLADNEVRAPLTGVVLDQEVEAGEVVTPGQLLFTVGDTSRLVLEVDIDEADVARVSDGSDGAPRTSAVVSLEAFPGKTFAGTLLEIRPDSDRVKKAFRAKVALTHPPPGLRSGMSAELNLVTAEVAGALIVPAGAVRAGTVWVVRGGTAQRRAVRTGLVDALRVEVTSGLVAGEEVVVSDPSTLRDGLRVVATKRTQHRDAPEPDTARPLRTSL